MPKAQNKDEFEVRMEVLWRFLCENAERELPWLETKSVLKARTKSENLTDVQLEYCIRRLRENLHAPNEIKIIGAAGPKDKAWIILHLRESESGRRERESPDEKRCIATVVWHTLLGKYSGEPEEEAPWLVMPTMDAWPDHVLCRLLGLRRRAFASLALDSGSTVRALARSLVDTPIMPFEAGIAPFQTMFEEDPAFRQQRLVLPTLITNSPLVVTDILESHNYNRFDVRLIGGNVGGDSAATTGVLAESCLTAWGYAGQFVSVDVAIVGTRGYMKDIEGQKGFMVSHLSQANIKSRLFGMAATKCVVLASNKIRHPDGVCRFARLSPADVHIVFTDSECKSEVATLFKDAKSNGVVAVVAAKNRLDALAVEDALREHGYNATTFKVSTCKPASVK